MKLITTNVNEINKRSFELIPGMARGHNRHDGRRQFYCGVIFGPKYATSLISSIRKPSTTSVFTLVINLDNLFGQINEVGKSCRMTDL